MKEKKFKISFFFLTYFFSIDHFCFAINDFLRIYFFSLYEGESKVLQYFCNIRHILASLDAFVLRS